MTREASDDDTEVSAFEELFDELRRNLCIADENLGRNPQGAALFVTAKHLEHIQRGDQLKRTLGRPPGPTPDKTLSQLARSIEGLEEGIIDPMLAHAEERRVIVVDGAADKRRGVSSQKLTVNVQLGRATAAAMMEFLYRADKKRWKLSSAAQEVATILKGHSILTEQPGRSGKPAASDATRITRWREDIMGRVASARQVERFNAVLSEAQRQVQVKGNTHEACVLIADYLCRHGEGL